jgi:hypothetical protein
LKAVRSKKKRFSSRCRRRSSSGISNLIRRQKTLLDVRKLEAMEKKYDAQFKVEFDAIRRAHETAARRPKATHWVQTA